MWGRKRPDHCGEFSKQPLSSSIFFWRNTSYSSPLVQTSTWPLTQLSLALSLDSCSRSCASAGSFRHPGPSAGTWDLIVLKHSYYHQIFQCPLSLVSDLHICWNTVGCSLCSSDQLGVSLVLRGSGLLSHLSRRHLLTMSFDFCIDCKQSLHQNHHRCDHQYSVRHCAIAFGNRILTP